MGLNWRDGVATALVATGVALFAADAAGTPVIGFSGTRALTAAVLGLGLAACIVGGGAMASLRGRWTTFASSAGILAFATGVAGIVSGDVLWLRLLVGLTGGMWLLTTARHAFTTPEPPPVAERREDRELVGSRR